MSTAPVHALREKAGHLPETPGVYLWLDARGRVIYVGKAKNLRSRVLSYFREEGDGRPQVPWLMANATGLDYIMTDTEMEALFTEANLIRARKPRYNVRLKDDKRYPSIKITNEEYPRIHVTRAIADDGARYLGPYTDAVAVRRTLALVHSLFPLRTCALALPSKQLDRACINYQMKRCCGPCMDYISREDYRRLVDDAVQFIQGHNTALVIDLERRMREEADNERFERAAELRDRITAVRSIVERRRAFSTERLTGDWDAVNFYVIDDEACAVVMEVRDGVVLGKKDYIMNGVSFTSPPAMLAAFLAQYYLGAVSISPELHLPIMPEDADMLGALLTERSGAAVTVRCPRRGEKARLVRLAATNAEHLLRLAIEKRDRTRDAVPGILLALKRDLRLAAAPRTIACIDISHLHGTDTVASLVFFGDGKPVKGEYRHFKIRTVAGIDDFRSMGEVVTRYFSRRIAEKKPLPDLLLVDGGKGQLASALTALKGLALDTQPVAGLAKRLEEVFVPGSSEAQNIPKTSSALHLLQRIRDEAHRFAITHQRSLRGKRAIASSLNNIPGIGKARARALLERFGSVARIREASREDIAAVPGIGPVRAAQVAETLTRETNDDDEQT